MNYSLITAVLFVIVLILLKWKKFIVQFIKSRVTGTNGQVDVNVTPKYVSNGLQTIARAAVLSFLYSRQNPQTKDTIYNKLYEALGSPKSKNRYQISFSKFIKFVYPQDYHTVKAILYSEVCSDRFPKRLSQNYFSGPGKGILFNSGEGAKELRRYTMKTLGQLGFGKQHKMTDIINEQLVDLLETMESLVISTNNKVQVCNLFTLSVINIVWCIIGGEKFDRNDEKFHFIVENTERLTNFGLVSAIPALYFPPCVLLFLDNFGFEYRKTRDALTDLDKYFQDYIEKKKLSFVESDPTDFVDYFLLEMEKHKSDKHLNKIYCQDQLSFVLLDLFAAGMDTTSKYMESSFMLLVLNPEIQIQVQKEIDSVIGVGAPSYTNHRKRMPFTEATIMEIHRLGNVGAQMPRLTNKDWHVGDQHFEKGTFIMANFFFFRMDESYWGDPKAFRPQRFLDSENNLILEKVNHILPYGAGSRGCIGESVATASIFVFLTGILQRYSLTQSDHNEFLGLHKGFVSVSHPEPFHVSLKPRNI